MTDHTPPISNDSNHDPADARLLAELDALAESDRQLLGGETIRKIVRASGATARAGSTAPIRIHDRQPASFITPRLRLAAGIAVVGIAGLSAWLATRPAPSIEPSPTNGLAAAESVDAELLLAALDTFDDVFESDFSETTSAVEDIESDIDDFWGEFDAFDNAIGTEVAL